VRKLAYLLRYSAEVRSLAANGRAMSRIILGILAIVALYYLFIYNDWAAFLSIADRLSHMFTQQLRQDGQL
jgi:hypothetical protein